LTHFIIILVLLLLLLLLLLIIIIIIGNAFFLGGRRGTRTPKHFMNLMGESKHFKMFEFPLNQLQMYYGYLCDLCPLTTFIFYDLIYKMVIFLSQTKSTPKHFFRKKALIIGLLYLPGGNQEEHVNSSIVSSVYALRFEHVTSQVNSISCTIKNGLWNSLYLNLFYLITFVLWWFLWFVSSRFKPWTGNTEFVILIDAEVW
jgi:hypothetical protein